ncbi:MAG: hypothetical protein ACLSAC_08475 [Enterocloster bolteae]
MEQEGPGEKVCGFAGVREGFQVENRGRRRSARPAKAAAHAKRPSRQWWGFWVSLTRCRDSSQKVIGQQGAGGGTVLAGHGCGHNLPCPAHVAGVIGLKEESDSREIFR